MALTALAVKNASPATGKDGKPSTAMLADGNGLYLRIGATGGKSWIYRFQIAGKRRDMGIGNLADLPLAKAREEVATLGKLVRQGIDPIDHREAQRTAQQQAEAAAQTKAMTFGEAATDYIDSQKDGWQNAKHIDQWRNTLTTYCSKFADKAVGTVTLDDVEAALRPVWLKKTETATRVLARIVSVMKFAKLKGWSDTQVSDWPDDVRALLPALPKKAQRVEHHPALPFAQVGAFMAELRKSTAMGTRALEFAILCASRSGEVRKATWAEFDLDAALWVIPKARMKAKNEHRVPLSSQAVELLRALPPGRAKDFVFQSTKPEKELSDMTMLAFIRRQNKDQAKWTDDSGNEITQHGFRSTFSTWASETTPFPSNVVEMALAHTIGNKVEAAYRRGDLFQKRRELMQAWADYCG